MGEDMDFCVSRQLIQQLPEFGKEYLAMSFQASLGGWVVVAVGVESPLRKAIRQGLHRSRPGAPAVNQHDGMLGCSLCRRLDEAVSFVQIIGNGRCGSIAQKSFQLFVGSASGNPDALRVQDSPPSTDRVDLELPATGFMALPEVSIGENREFQVESSIGFQQSGKFPRSRQLLELLDQFLVHGCLRAG